MTPQPKHERRYDLEDRLVAFAAGIMDLVEALPRTRSGNHLAGQLVRCGTSPAANYAEARAAESRKDFVHRMKVALKELRETRMWLRVIELRKLCGPKTPVPAAFAECEELIAIFATSVRTAERNTGEGPALPG